MAGKMLGPGGGGRGWEEKGWGGEGWGDGLLDGSIIGDGVVPSFLTKV